MRPRTDQPGADRHTNRRLALRGARRLVVKVGSAVLARQGQLQPRVVHNLARDVAAARSDGREVVLVASGAVAAGYAELGLGRVPAAVLERQAAAALGQPKLVALFDRALARHGLHAAQVLMSAEDIENRQRFLSARHTLQYLLDHHVVPVINENDALSEHEATVGDNDHLAAMVASVVSAGLLVILSNVDGVYADNDPKKLISEVAVGSRLDAHIRRDLSETGVGGMAAKVSAAHLASHWGVPTVIARGGRRDLLQRVLAGEPIGTLFVPRAATVRSRKRWIAVRSRSRGRIVVDDGARRALVERNASLLPAGVVDAVGDFAMGARVDIADQRGHVFAVGLSSYACEEIRRIRGRKRAAIREILGYEYVREIVHRDDLIVL